MKTVNDLYKLSKAGGDDNFPLLTNFSSGQEVDWWAEYVEYFEIFDFQFNQQFKTFVFFDQDPEDTDEEIMDKWDATLFSWFAMNDKRYSELYRIYVIPDDDSYVLTNNYDLHETYSGTNSNTGAVTTGQRTDLTYDNIGNQNSAGINKVTAFNSSSENTNTSNEQSLGSKQDTHQFTKGQETDTSQAAGTDAHTLRRYGNIGVVDVDTMLQRHSNFWQLFNFYKIIFDDICKNFLLIGGM